MKRVYVMHQYCMQPLMVLFFAIIIAFTPALLSAGPLQIYVDLVSVTPENASNVLEGEGVGRDGCVHYDYTTHTLTLRNAKLNKWLKITGETPDQLITVRLEGENVIETKTWAFWISTPVIIEGPGSLFIHSTGTHARGITLSGDQPELYLKIRNTNVRIEAVNEKHDGEALFSPNVRDGYVVLENTHFYSEGLVGGMKEIYLQGCDIVNSDEVYLGYRDDGCAVVGAVNNNKYNYGPLEIVPNNHYPIAIGRTQVTRDNASDILSAEGHPGAASYDAVSNTLYLKDVDLDVGLENGVFTRFAPIDPTLNINIQGEVTLRSDLSGMFLFGNTCIGGDGSLRLYARDNTDSFAGILFSEKDTLTIRGCYLYAEGTFGLAGLRQHSRLVIENAALDLYCTNAVRGAAAEGFDALAMRQSILTKPQGVYFDPNCFGFTVNGVDLCKDLVQISRTTSLCDVLVDTPSITTEPGRVNITLSDKSVRARIYTLEGMLVRDMFIPSIGCSIPLESGCYLIDLEGYTPQEILIP